MVTIMNNGFPKVDIELTDEQMLALQPLSALLEKAIEADKPGSGGTLIAEAFVVSSSHKFKRLEVRYIDKIAAKAVSNTLIAAQDDYVKRHEAKERLTTIQQRLADGSMGPISTDGERLLFTFAGHQYVVKELA